MRPVQADFPVTQDFASLATRGVVGREFGSEVEHLVFLYGNYQPDGHNGTDIGCPVGTPVYAVRGGTVVLCDWDVNLPGDDSWSASGYFQRFAFFKRFGGRLLVVKVAPNDYDVYAHLSAWKVGYGQTVSEGQLVALSGDSSAGMDGQLGPHLHTERIVDLSYSTGNGEIYGRIDPTSLWGGLAAQGSITAQEEDMPLTKEDVDNIAARVVEVIQPIEDVTRQYLADRTRDGVLAVLNGSQAQEDVTRAYLADTTQAQSDVTRQYLADRIKETPPADLAGQINAAGIATQVRDELVKLIGGK